MSLFHKSAAALMLFSLVACAAPKVPLPDSTSAPSSLSTTLKADLSPATSSPEEGLRQALDAYKAGNSEAALRLARRVEEWYPDTAWYRRSLFLAEQSLIRLDRPADADAAMLRVRNEYAELGDYAVYFLAEYHFGASRFTQAAALFSQVPVLYPRSSLASRALVRQAQALMQTFAYAQAAETLEGYLQENARSDSAPDATLLMGQALLSDSRMDEAVRAFRNVGVRYPGTPADQEAGRTLEWLSTCGVDVPAWTSDELYERARNLFRTAQYDKAADAYAKLLELDPRSLHRAEALLRIGVSQFWSGRRGDAVASLEKLRREYPRDERVPEALYWTGKAWFKLGDREKALAAYQKILASYRDSEWADDALFLSGNIYRDANEMKKALRFYKRLVAEFPDSKFADSALWWNAWSYYRSEEYDKADQALQELINRYPRSFLVHQARYWRGRIAEKKGNTGEAYEHYTQVLKRGAFTYYGYRAAERLAGSRFTDGSAAAAVNASFDLPPDCEEGDCTGDSLPASDSNDAPPVWTEEARQVLAREPSFRKSLELMQLDLKKEAAAELGSLQDRLPRRPGTVIGLSKAFFELGDYHRSLMLVLRNYERYLDAESVGTSPDLWMLAYPQGYWDSILSYAHKYGQDPYFIAAVIREESRFRMEALSPAGARGVMQVMPATGQRIAQSIRLQGFDASKLFEPDTAINIGTWYIGSLMKRFKGDPLLVAAAYNAGPEAVAAWIGRNGSAGERDEFVELIPFAETRSYVKKVLRNYAEYKRIYGKAAPPQAKLHPATGIPVSAPSGEQPLTTP